MQSWEGAESLIKGKGGPTKRFLLRAVQQLKMFSIKKPDTIPHYNSPRANK